MTHGNMKILMATVLLIAGTALTATAEIETIVTFDGMPEDLQCGDVWQENGADLYFTMTTAEDCSEGSCSFDYEPEMDDGLGEVWMWPSRIVIDLGIPMVVHRIEVDWTDYCGIGCTMAFAYNLGATVDNHPNTMSGNMETITLVPASMMVDMVALSTCEGVIHEVRFYTDVVLNETGTSSNIKAIYE